MKRQRRNFTGAEKVAILRRHLVDKVPVSELCEEAGLQPTQFYQWQKQFFEQGATAFERAGRPKVDKSQERIAALEAKLRRKDEVLGELMEEHVALKKELGEL
jgi:transposase-like protein